MNCSPWQKILILTEHSACTVVTPHPTQLLLDSLQQHLKVHLHHTFNVFVYDCPLVNLSTFQGPFMARRVSSCRHLSEQVSHFAPSVCPSAAGGRRRGGSAGQEVQIPSSIPLNWIPGSSGVGSSERSVLVCECTFTTVHVCVCVSVYYGEKVHAGSFALHQSTVRFFSCFWC